MKFIRSAALSTTSLTIWARARGGARNWQQWRADIDAVYRGAPPPAACRAGRRRCAASTCSARISSPSSTAWRWTLSPTSARRTGATLDLYCDRVACAVGRLSVRVFGMERDAGLALAHHLGRALQLTNILRDLDEDASLGRLYLPREELQARGYHGDRSGRRCWRIRRSASLRRHRRAGGRPSFMQREAIMAQSPRRVVRAPRIMGEAYHAHSRYAGRARLCATARAGPSAARKAPPHRVAQSRVMSGTVHIIGAGLAGLSAAVRLTARGRNVVVHEATAFAGGRCRSYHDASVGMTIDNGNHLLLSGNRAALDYLRSIGAEHRLIGPATAEFSFADLASGERWTLRFNDGRLPFWIFDPDAARARHARARLSAAGAAALGAGRQGGRRGHRAARALSIERLVEPLLLAALNIDAAAGIGAACGRDHSRDARRRRARVPPADRARRFGLDAGRTGASNAARSAARRCGMEHQLRGLRFAAERVEALDFGGETVALDEGRRGHPDGAALCRGVAGARPRRADASSAPSSTRISASSRRPGSRRSSA